jgi:hypothetical protein
LVPVGANGAKKMSDDQNKKTLDKTEQEIRNKFASVPLEFLRKYVKLCLSGCRIVCNMMRHVLKFY